ncbi:hypothetical protein [Thalassotalea sp. PS06]|uniref:hypothetical protein n=1 Tax=Thalassotalea sp. PS06 TaxID=2594005 RepID=UPI0011639119|nr:hypothetical protein [Thalassotalea sp. PS06]QDP01522.1 hypothetical protein FNC98_09350 [Thalassotalea sp. PS06]
MTIFSWFNQNKTTQISDSNNASTGNRLSKDNLIPLNKRGKSMWPVAKVRLTQPATLSNEAKPADSVSVVTDISDRIDSDLVGEKYVIND